MFIVTFMSALFIKDFHVHPDYLKETFSQCAGHKPVVHGTCFICDFTFQKADGVKVLHFMPVVTVKRFGRPVLSVRTVVRDVESVNVHSPPFLV